MAKIAFCGLGRMGMPMATRLVEAGHTLQVWNRDQSKAQPLAAKGATVAGSPREAAQGCEVVVTMLADPNALEEVLFGKDGVIEGISSKTVLLEMSTVGPQVIQKMVEQLKGKAIMLDAPVRGSIAQAAGGQLRILVGGEQADFAKVEPVLAVMGQPIHVGATGAGAGVKLLLNAALLDLSVALGEIMALADGLGIEQKLALDELSQTALGPLVNMFRASIEQDSYTTNFALALARKDLGLVDAAARQTKRHLPANEAALQWLEAAEKAGFDQQNFSAVVKFIRQQNQNNS